MSMNKSAYVITGLQFKSDGVPKEFFDTGGYYLERPDDEIVIYTGEGSDYVYVGIAAAKCDPYSDDIHMELVLPNNLDDIARLIESNFGYKCEPGEVKHWLVELWG